MPLALVVSVAVAHPSAHRVEEGEHEEERPPRAHLRRRRRRRVRGHLDKKTSTASGPPRPRSGSRVLASCRPSSSFSLPSLLTEPSERGQLCSLVCSALTAIATLSRSDSLLLLRFSLSSFSPPVGPPLSLVLLPSLHLLSVPFCSLDSRRRQT